MPSTFRCCLYAYPWALHVPDLDRSLDRVALSGCDELVVTPVYHRADFYQPADPDQPVCYGEPGVVFFDLDESLYADTPIRPRLGRQVRDATDIERARGVARDRGIDWSLWMIYNFQDELSERYPAFARHDPFGQPHRGALSLGAGEVMAYFRALTSDVLTRFEPTVVWIESLYRRAMAMPGKSRAPMSDRAKLLLSLDWNPGMMAHAEAAGVPARELRDEVVRWLRGHLPKMPKGPDGAPVDDGWLQTAFDGGLAAYVDACRQVTTALWIEIADQIHGAGSGIYHQPVGASSLGTDLDDSVNVHIDRVMMATPTPEQLGDERRRFAAGCEIYVPFHGPPESEASVAADVRSARDLGADGVSFYAHGLLLDEQLTWVGNAMELNT